MKLDAALPLVPLTEIPAIAAAAEAMGFDALIAEHSSRLGFGTAVAIAFARSPATLAYTSWDLAQASSGRFILGLGTQVKGHIERRFGMEWPDSPVNKLRDQIRAIRAFWNTWQTGEKLNYRSDYYKLTLMSPFFNPGPIEYPQIPIYIAGVNTGMARLAGEVADGFHVHPFNSPRYVREVVLPAIKQGAEKAGRVRSDITVSVSAFTATDPAEREFARQQISFYASTPSYRPVMALHGWEDTAAELSNLAGRGRWEEMPGMIDDEMLATFGTLGDTEALPAALFERYHGIADRITVYIPFIPGERDGFWENLLLNKR
jgi:probable F420-dependent oxidoreductase